MIIEQLENMGLTKGESRVYLALLEVGQSTVTPIVKESRVAYSKIYDVLQRLIEKGLATYIIKKSTRYYQALPPKRLEELLDRKEKELEINREVLKKLLPSLAGLEKKDEESTQLFLGEKGITSAYEIVLDAIENKGVVRFFYMHREEYFDKAKNFYVGKTGFDEMMKSYFLKKKVTWKAVLNVPVSAKKKRAYLEERYAGFPVPGNIDITNNHVLITQWGEKPMAILIKSKEIAKNFVDYFETVWVISKK